MRWKPHVRFGGRIRETGLPKCKHRALVRSHRSGLAHAQGGGAMGADRYMVHAVVDVSGPDGGLGRSQLADGTPLERAILSRILCDTSVVVHGVEGDEPLSLGRKTKVWNQAQRRALKVRDGICRFPGCHRSIVDIHHLSWWSKGGRTDIANGLLLCDQHHTLMHRGFDAKGDANHEVTFFRPDGTVIDTSTPPGRPAVLRAVS